MRKFMMLILMTSLVSIGYGQTYQSAIGLKGGSAGGRYLGGGGVNFKHFFSGSNAIELTAGGGSNSLHFQALYEWQHSTGWTEGLDWYLGVGGTIGFWNTAYTHPIYDDNYNQGVYLGANGVIGLDWNIEPATGVPIGFAVDSGPYIGIINSNTFGWGGGFAVRYIIK